VCLLLQYLFGVPSIEPETCVVPMFPALRTHVHVACPLVGGDPFSVSWNFEFLELYFEYIFFFVYLSFSKILTKPAEDTCRAYVLGHGP